MCPWPFATSLIHCHAPSGFWDHSEILLSPPETAKIFPFRDQLTFHSTSSNWCKMVEFQLMQSLEVQMTTLRSCEQDAIVCLWMPTEGAQATSLTQSECTCKLCWLPWFSTLVKLTSNLVSSIHWSPSSLHIFTRLSHPPDTNRLTSGCCSFSLPLKNGVVAGAQLTELHPMAWAFWIFLASQLFVSGV